MDTNVLENSLKKVLFNDSLEVFVFNVFEDSVIKYKIVDGTFTNTGTDTLTNFLDNAKSKIDSSYVSGFMNLVSIPKLKEKEVDGKSKVSFKYQALDSKWYKFTSTLINVNNNELIFSVKESLDNQISNSSSITDSKYNGLIGRLADAILKIENLFNLDKSKTNINNLEEYINSILNGIISSYPEIKKSLNQNFANVTGRVDDVILIVDDDALTRNMIKKVFSDEYKIVMKTNGKEAIEYLSENSKKGITESSDNILGIFLDLTMPVMDGFSVLEYLSKNNYLYRIPVIIISGDYEKETKTRVYNYAVADMLEKPFDFQIVKHRIGNFINLYKSSNSLNKLISDQSSELKDLINPFVESYRYDYKDNILNIKKYVKTLGLEVMGDYSEYMLDEEKIEKMSEAVEYYDIGFYSIPRSILYKKDNLSTEELSKVKNYPLFGYKMLNYILSLRSDELYKKYAKNITKCYHENYDGTGYPNKLLEDNIPIEAQIASICINYYNLKRKYGLKAFDIIISKKGTHFNPKLIDSFIKLKDKFI